MYGLFIGLIIVSSILLILVVLIQKPKGGGLAAQFSSSNLTFGVKRTSDFIEKATWGLAIAIIAFAMLSNFFVASPEEGAKKEAINTEQLQELPATQYQQPTNAAPAQEGDASAEQAPE